MKQHADPAYVAKTVTEGIRRWGAKNYGTGEFSLAEVVNALVFLWGQQEERESDTILELREKLKLANKQLAAAKAREARAKKRTEGGDKS